MFTIKSMIEISWMILFLFFTLLVALVSMEIDYLGKFNFLLGKIECRVVYRHCKFSELEDLSSTSSSVVSWLTLRKTMPLFLYV